MHLSNDNGKQNCEKDVKKHFKKFWKPTNIVIKLFVIPSFLSIYAYNLYKHMNINVIALILLIYNRAKILI